jgi:hypothetical protein
VFVRSLSPLGLTFCVLLFFFIQVTVQASLDTSVPLRKITSQWVIVESPLSPKATNDQKSKFLRSLRLQGVNNNPTFQFTPQLPGRYVIKYYASISSCAIRFETITVIAECTPTPPVAQIAVGIYNYTFTGPNSNGTRKPNLVLPSIPARLNLSSLDAQATMMNYTTLTLSAAPSYDLDILASVTPLRYDWTLSSLSSSSETLQVYGNVTLVNGTVLSSAVTYPVTFTAPNATWTILQSSNVQATRVLHHSNILYNLNSTIVTKTLTTTRDQIIAKASSPCGITFSVSVASLFILFGCSSLLPPLSSCCSSFVVVLSVSVVNVCSRYHHHCLGNFFSLLEFLWWFLCWHVCFDSSCQG